MNLKRIFSLILATLFSLPSLHASKHVKKAAVTTLVAASILSGKSEKEEKSDDGDDIESRSALEEGSIDLTTKNLSIKSPAQTTVSKNLGKFKKEKCLYGDYSIYNISFKLNEQSKGLDDKGLKTFILEGKYHGAVGISRSRFHIEKDLKEDILSKSDWEFFYSANQSKTVSIDSIMAVDPAGFSNNKKKDETGYAIVKRLKNGKFSVIDVGGLKSKKEDNVDQACEVFELLAKKACENKVNRILVENQTFGILWSTFFKFWISKSEEYKNIEITTSSPLSVTGEGKFERIIKIIVPLLKDKKVLFDKKLLSDKFLCNEIIKEVNRLRMTRSKNEKRSRINYAIGILKKGVELMSSLEQLRSKERAQSLKSELTSLTPDLKNQLELLGCKKIASNLKKLEKVSGKDELLEACEELIGQIYTKLNGGIEEKKKAYESLDEDIKKLEKATKHYKIKKSDTWINQFYAILLGLKEGSFHDDRVDVLAMALSFLDPDMCVYSLDLSCSPKLSYDGLIYLKRLSSLNILILKKCSLGKKDLKAIAQIIHLTNLDLSGNEGLSEAGDNFLSLKSLYLLKTLILKNCNLGKENLDWEPKLKGSIPNLKISY